MDYESVTIVVDNRLESLKLGKTETKIVVNCFILLTW